MSYGPGFRAGRAGKWDSSVQTRGGVPCGPPSLSFLPPARRHYLQHGACAGECSGPVVPGLPPDASWSCAACPDCGVDLEDYEGHAREPRHRDAVLAPHLLAHHLREAESRGLLAWQCSVCKAVLQSTVRDRSYFDDYVVAPHLDEHFREKRLRREEALEAERVLRKEALEEEEARRLDRLHFEELRRRGIQDPSDFAPAADPEAGAQACIHCLEELALAFHRGRDVDDFVYFGARLLADGSYAHSQCLEAVSGARAGKLVGVMDMSVDSPRSQ